jgi:hypothetical protein
MSLVVDVIMKFYIHSFTKTPQHTAVVERLEGECIQYASQSAHVRPALIIIR